MDSNIPKGLLSYFVKVRPDYVVQMVINVLAQRGENSHWLTKTHLKELDTLLVDVMRRRVNEELERRQQTRGRRRRWREKVPAPSKDTALYTQPQILTGETLRMAYSFNKRTSPQRHLLLNTGTKGYSHLHIFDEKLVVYVYHLEGYLGYQMPPVDKHLLSLSTDQQQGVSSYFGQSEPTDNSQHHGILKNMTKNKTKISKHHKRKGNIIQNNMSEVLPTNGDIKRYQLEQSNGEKIEMDFQQYDIASLKRDKDGILDNIDCLRQDSMSESDLKYRDDSSSKESWKCSNKRDLENGSSNSKRKRRRKQFKYECESSLDENENENTEPCLKSRKNSSSKRKLFGKEYCDAGTDVNISSMHSDDKRKSESSDVDVTKHAQNTSSQSTCKSSELKTIENIGKNKVNSPETHKKFQQLSNEYHNDKSISKCGIKLKLCDNKTLVTDVDGYRLNKTSEKMDTVCLDPSTVPIANSCTECNTHVEDSCPKNSDISSDLTVTDSSTISMLSDVLDRSDNTQVRLKQRKKKKKLPLLDIVWDDIDDILSPDGSTKDQRSTKHQRNLESEDVFAKPQPVNKFAKECLTTEAISSTSNTASCSVPIAEIPKKNYKFKRLKLVKKKMSPTQDMADLESNSALNTTKFGAEKCHSSAKAGLYNNSIVENSGDYIIHDETSKLQSKYQSERNEETSVTEYSNSLETQVDSSNDRAANDVMSKPLSPDLPCLSQYLRFSHGGVGLQEPKTVITDVEVEDLFSDCFIREELSDPVIIKIEDCEVDRMDAEIKQVKLISRLSDDQLIYLISNNEKYLRNIFQGKVHNRRHEDYKTSMKKRAHLVWQIPLGLYKESQVEVVLQALQNMFCKKHTKYLDYVLKVMFPEILIKIYMDVFSLDNEAAEDELANATYMSDTQSQIATDSSS